MSELALFEPFHFDWLRADGTLAAFEAVTGRRVESFMIDWAGR
jgi:hypothetical protein